MREELKKKLQQYSLPGYYAASAEAAVIPEHLHEGILNYICDGVTPGGFFTAVVCNDLRGAFEYGDAQSCSSLHAIVGFMYNHAPASCWGSSQRMREWQQSGGLSRPPKHVDDA